MSRKFSLPKLIISGVILLFCLINLFPVFNIALNSLRQHRDIIVRPIAFNQLSFENYIKAPQHSNILIGLFNGVAISFLTIVLLLFAGSLSAYALVFLKNKTSNFITVVITLGYFIPPASLVINGFMTLRDFHLLNTYLGITLIYGALFTPVTLIVFKGYMEALPVEVMESAKIDGASYFTIYRSIIIPMSKPVLVTMIILLFIWTYRNFLWPLILMQEPGKRTISVILSTFVGDRQFDLGMMSAAVMISLVPIFTTYVILKDKIMMGMAAGSVKG